jgi:hypothetical protein
VLVLNNVATQDQYAAALTLEDDQADTLTYVVANASVRARFRRIAHRGGAEEPYGDEVLLTPTANTVRNVSGVQFRSAVAGQSALVIAILTSPLDPQLAAGTPFTQTLSAAGQASQVGVITKIALGSFPPAAPQDGQVVLVPWDTTHEYLFAFNSTTGYWDCIGGVALTAEVVARESTTSTTYAALATAGPSILLPRFGDYEITLGAEIDAASGRSVGAMSFDVGGVAALDADRAAGPTVDFQENSTPAHRRMKTGIAANTNIVSKYKNSLAATTVFYANRWISIMPLRVQ